MSTPAELVADVERDARTLAESLKAANEAGVSPALILPRLVLVFREAGMMPEGFTLPGFGGAA